MLLLLHIATIVVIIVVVIMITNIITTIITTIMLVITPFIWLSLVATYCPEPSLSGLGLRFMHLNVVGHCWPGGFSPK